MKITVQDKSIRYTGRWDINAEAATTTAPGGMIEVAFQGKAAVLYFDMTSHMQPYPHVWISVDDGAKIETVLTHVVRVEAPETGNHVVRVIYKSAVLLQHRWYQPLIGKLCFTGAEVDSPGNLPEDNRKTIEFIGDSITEGVLVDATHQYELPDALNRPMQDDATATYAYLTAEALGMKPVIMGYGAVGVTRGGHGGVPKAAEAYPFHFHGAKATPKNPDIVVINHGANDTESSAEEYIFEYEKLLKIVRQVNPDAKIVVLSAFCVVYPKQLASFIEKFNKENDDVVYFIDSSGWVPKEPLHPLRDGHKIIAEKLTKRLREILQ